MFSQKTLSLIHRYFKITSLTCILPYEWDAEKMQLSYTKSKIKNTLYCLVQAWLFFELIYIPFQTGKSMLFEDFMASISVGLMDILFCTFTVCVCYLSVCVLYQRDLIPLTFNQLIRLNMDLSSRLCQKGMVEDMNSKKYKDGGEFLLEQIINHILQTPIAFVLLYVTNKKFTRNFLAWIGTDISTEIGDVDIEGEEEVKITIRYNWIYWAGTVWEAYLGMARPAMFLFFGVFIIMYCRSVTFWLQFFLKGGKQQVKNSDEKKEVKKLQIQNIQNIQNTLNIQDGEQINENKKIEDLDGETVLKIYEAFQVLNANINVSWRNWFIPCVKLLNLGFQVVPIFSIVRFHDVMSHSSLIYFSLVIFAGFVAQFSIYPLAAQSYIVSKNLLDHFHSNFMNKQKSSQGENREETVQRQKWIRMKLKSYKPLRVHLMNLYYFKRSTCLVFLGMVFDTTMNFVLMKL